MPDLTTAIDETAANVVVPKALATQTLPAQAGSSGIGPFGVAWTANAFLSGGTVDLIPPPTNVIRVDNCRLNYTVGLTISLDLSFLNFCLPRVCVRIPFIGRVCSPKICITFPTIQVPVSHSGFVDFGVDLRLQTALVGSTWQIDAVLVAVPTLALGPSGTALVAAIGAAITLALLAVPFIGPLLALASAIIFGAFTVANLLGLLGSILTPFVAGLTVRLHDQPQLFQLLPASGSDAAVMVRLDDLDALLDGSAGEDELIFTAEISAP